MTSEVKEAPQIPVSEAILSVVASLLLSIFLSAFIYLLNEGIAMVAGEVLLVVVPLGYMLSKNVEIKKYVKMGLTTKNILLGVAVGALLLYFDALLTIALTSVFGPSEIVEESNKIIMKMSSSIEGLILVVATLISAGICEEFTFRGFLQTALSNRYSLWIALIVSSFMFSFMHFDPQGIYMIAAFLLSLVLGFVYHRWRSYTLCAIAHATLNLIALSITLFG